MDNTHLAT